MLPLQQAQELQSAITEYLKATFTFRDTRLHDAFHRFLLHEREGLFRGPFISVQLPFRKADPDKEVPLEIKPDFTPFIHQLTAFERLSARGKEPQPTLLTTGTGSGKTEAFLFPLLDYCYQNRHRKGIKAIILYPMNALATDQAERLAQLIWQDERLKGEIRAGLFIGAGSGKDKQFPKVMQANNIIEDRDTIISTVPDILLTNFKMLDYGLMRNQYHALWHYNFADPELLRFLVLDELHTYDGAQGSDVANLIRRLKLKLGLELGKLCPVGTSATIGEGPDAVKLLTGYASKIFGETFPDEAVIPEDRLSWSEFFGPEPAANDFIPDKGSIQKSLLQENDQYEDYLRKQRVLWRFEGETGAEVADQLRELTVFRHLLEVSEGGLHKPETLIHRLARKNQAFAQLPEKGDEPGFLPRYAVLESLLALTSHAKELPRNTPFVYLRVQSWIRELSGIMRYVQEEPAFTWRDSRKPQDARKDGETAALPLYFCRECGASGWLTRKKDNHNSFETDTTDIFRDYFSKDRNVYFLNTDIAAHAPVSEAGMTDTLNTRVDRSSLKFGSKGDENLIRLVAARKVNEKGKTEHICPECATTNSISIVGTRTATLASVAVSQTLSSNLEVKEDGDRKVLAFSNSVQDAAHHAGFMQARNYRFMFRTSLQQVLSQMGSGTSLTEVIRHFRLFWISKLGSAERYAWRFYPEDCEKRAPLSMYLRKDNTFSPDFFHELDHRISWEIIAEFGYNALIGRTLQKTGNATVYVDRGRFVGLFQALRPWMAGNLMESVQEQDFLAFSAGLLFRLRTRGAIDHRHYAKFRTERMELWSLNWSRDRRHYLNRRYGKSSRLPKLLTTKPYKEGLLDTTFTRQLNWFHAWFKKSFRLVPDNTAVINEFYGELLEALTKAGMADKQVLGGLPSYALLPDVFRTSLNVEFRQCDQCNHRISVATEDQALDGSRCQQYRCEGSYTTKVETVYTYYNKVYSRSHAPRVLSHEHTGILSRTNREEVERSFRSSDEDRSLNALVATSTLEMGINIGDLDVACNMGIPPLPANYLQRIGRAGRKSGSSLISNFAASGNPHDLYFLLAPYEMMAGKVHTPGCFLNAPEILKRQLLAHFIDSWVAENPEKHTIPALMMHLKVTTSDLRSEAFFINRILAWVKARQDELFGRLYAMYEPHLRPELLHDLSEEIKNGSFEEWLFRPLYSLKNKLLTMRQLRWEIAEDIKKRKLGKQDEERILLEQESKGLFRAISRAQRQQVVEFMTTAGLLPNYAFPEKGVELMARVWQPAPPGSKAQDSIHTAEYVRPASTALRELAPHNAFYAEGYRYHIEGLGTYSWGKSESDLETFRFCSNCDHIDLAAGNEDKPCPKCGDESFGAASNKHSYALMTGSKSEVMREKAALDDSSDDRDLIVYKIIRHLRFPESSSGSLALVDIPFGIEFTPTVEIMETNVGKTETIHADRVQIAQQEGIPKHGFVTCRHCGYATNNPGLEQDPQNHRKTPFHFPYCKHRDKRYSGQTTDVFEEVYLYRSQKTEALKMLLPTQEFESKEYRQIFKAGIELGLKAFYQGNPSHLSFIEYQEFNKSTGKFDQYLVLYDRVPGGTGYLFELYDRKVFTDILALAYDKIKSCTCQFEDKEACYHCVYSYRNKFFSDVLTRRKAEEIFEKLLKHAANWKVLDHSLSDVTKDGQIEESELEEKFVFMLQKWSEKQNLSFQKQIVNHVTQYFMEVKLPEFLSRDGRLVYQIRPQVRLGKANGLPVSQRCDFLMMPVSVKNADPNLLYSFPKMIVELDGYNYHASAKNPRFHTDLEKRRAILKSEGYNLWVLTWDDVSKFGLQLEGEKNQDKITDELNIGQARWKEGRLKVKTIPLAKDVPSEAQAPVNSFERFLNILAIPFDFRNVLFRNRLTGFLAMSCTASFPLPFLTTEGAAAYLKNHHPFDKPPYGSGVPEMSSLVRSGWSMSNPLFEARVCSQIGDGTTQAVIKLKRSGTQELEKAEWQHFWRLLNLLQFSADLRIIGADEVWPAEEGKGSADGDASEAEESSESATDEAALLEVYDESVHRIIRFCAANHIFVDPEGGFTLVDPETGAELAGAELGFPDKKIVFDPFGREEEALFRKQGYEIANPNTFELSRLL